MKLINEGSANLKFLIESGMERASLVLAAQAITDKLQSMAENLAKIEASDVMPMMDSMKENFGADVAQRFETTVSEKLRDLTEALRQARDHIGNEIIRMEASVNGEPVSDMAMDDGTGEDPAPDNDMANSDDGMDAPSEDDAAPDAMGADTGAPASDDAMGSDDGSVPAGDAPSAPNEGPEDFSSLFKDNGNAAGRARKESAERPGSKMLRESRDPDALIFRVFNKTIKEGHSAKDSVDVLARYFEIDREDVVDAIMEHRKSK